MNADGTNENAMSDRVSVPTREQLARIIQNRMLDGFPAGATFAEAVARRSVLLREVARG